MKKLLSIVLSMLILSIVFVGCDGKNSSTASPNSTPSDISNSDTSDDNFEDQNTTPSHIMISNPTVSAEQIQYYTPTSLTLSFYDTITSSYGFTWNTEFEPKEAVIQICEGYSFDESKCKEYKATVKKEVVLMPRTTYIYVCKVSITLNQNKTYVYRAFDKTSGVGSELATFKTANLKSNSFKFVHISDSQVASSALDTKHTAEGTGEYLTDTLKGVFQNMPNFMIHTGDFVENSAYETYWKNMLHTNAQYLARLPVMALSGNHETTYLAGSNETFKHFNVKMPNQTTDLGYYYSFDYGNTKFIMLNTNNLENNRLETAQYNWLVNELKNNNKKWTIISMHNPMYSVGKYGADSSKNAKSLALREQLGKLFAEYNVDLVLQGHDHAYSKTYPISANGEPDKSSTYKTENSIKYTVNPKGTIYAMHGPAGNQSRYPFEVDTNLYEFASGSKECSWAEVSIENNRLTVQIKYYKNSQVETAYSYGIIKN